MKLFSNDREALLVERPNRFLMRAELLDPEGRATGEIVDCHCPNPGRLLEFLVPGTRLILEDRELFQDRRNSAHRQPRRPDASNSAKTRWTTVALYRGNSVVPLYASRANAAARDLVIPRIIPNLTELRAEFAIGRSRFDFLAVDSGNTRHLIEVKSCSLVESGAAMFPDAPSDRASKHLEELATLATEGYRSHALFVIAHGNPAFFAPNAHTDPVFAKTLAIAARNISIHAALTRTDSEGNASFVRSDVPVDLSSCRLAEADRGNYIAICERGGGKPEWLVQTGFAPERLTALLARMKRKGNPTGKTALLPILSLQDRTDELEFALSALGGRVLSGLENAFCFETPPLQNRLFLDLLFRFRAENLASGERR